MTLSDTIRRAAIGPTPKSSHGCILISSWGMGGDGFDHVYDVLQQGSLDDMGEFYDAPEEVQRMFLLFCAEDCES